MTAEDWDGGNADDQRFLFVMRSDEFENTAKFIVVENWVEELKAKVGRE